MLNANLKAVVAVVIAAGTVSGCAPFTTTQDAPPPSYSTESQALYAKGVQEMKRRRAADPQVPGWALVNPSDIRFTADP